MGAFAPLKEPEMTEKELIKWAKQNLQEVQKLKEKTEIQECGKNCYTLIGEIIKARREELNLSQRQLAEMLCTNTPNVANYELGNRGMSVQTLLKYCKVLKIKLKLNGITIK